MSDFGNNIDLEEETNALGSFLPGGRLFSARNSSGSFFRRFLTSVSKEIRRVRLKIIDIAYQHDINNTSELLTNWEKTVGIPDECFSLDYSIEDRRKHVIVKLMANGAQTEQYYIDLAAYLGYTITIEHPEDSAVTFPLEFPWEFSSARELRFTVIFHFSTSLAKGVFPLDFPWDFTSGATSFLECFFNTLKPVHVNFVYVYDL